MQRSPAWGEPRVDVGIGDEELAKVGYVIQSLKPGDGKTFPSRGSKIRLAYKGCLTDGTVFDMNESFECEIGVGVVILGWDKGVLKMSQGEEARLVCHYNHGYGERGDPNPPPIPPRATLIFELKLLQVLTKAQGPSPHMKQLQSGSISRMQQHTDSNKDDKAVDGVIHRPNPPALPIRQPEQKQSGVQPQSQQVGTRGLHHQRFSLPSEEALNKLATSKNDLSILEEQAAEALRLLRGGDLDGVALNQWKSRVRQLETEANNLLYQKVDDVQTSELNSGKAEAKDQKKHQISRLNGLFERIEEFFKLVKEKEKRISVEVNDAWHTEQKQPQAQAQPQQGGRRELQHQRYSLASKEALQQLAISQGDLTILEEQLAEALQLLQDGDLDRVTFSQLKTHVSQLEAAANKLQDQKVDEVQTSELKSGKAEAKDQKKQQINRLDILFERIEDFFRLMQ
eukprot:gnl/MRDRNA2_/MRDRNA2_67551_c0_seq4.p1 gnl/MRDRNA2_/MRDRNA2_67551_c0~~gnl/MRDRNA2_/MRDRNA2_67551_c0_seq4.p1  ORF type:complete len:455 (-),score=125.72 gnl/MRDRNA2_/MRDRNA2_67551_c0_seq4:138-1502(-)